jgi:lipoprotein-releasing system ATP-binding protein
MKKTILQAKNLCKSYYNPIEVPIFQEIDLSVAEGETVAIMGRSGEGKTTLLHILGTLEKACQGNIQIAGQDVTHFNKTTIRNRHIGFVFQSFHLLEDYTALENVLMPARIGRKGTSKNSDAYHRASELLTEVGLGNRIDFRTKQLSGGEKQRVAIARALCNNPDLILADEPSGNLDSQTSALIHDLLFRAAHEQNKAMVIVTHDPMLAKRCDRVLSLKNGQLVNE